MTREAKIGMLTGLGVIVLIGVLLSEYLGDPKGALAGNSATGQMAALPVGAAYRQELMTPVGVPGPARNDGLGGGEEARSAISTNDGMMPAAYAAQNVPGDLGTVNATGTGVRGPTIGQAVTAERVGPAPMDGAMLTGGPPTISLGDPRGVQNNEAVVGAADTSRVGAVQPPVGPTYVIAAGDNLAKIAKKFYNSSKESDVARIVAANPKVLKDASATLVVGKKLTIPMTPKTVTPAGKTGTVGTGVAKKTEPVMIYLPGNGTGMARDDGPVASKVLTGTKKESGKVYVVQSGDTLVKIARKIAPSKVSETVERLKLANAIKDPQSLAVGSRLKLPV